MKRVQRKREKGFKLPHNTTYVGRGSKWGNPLMLEGDMIYVDASYRRQELDKWVFVQVGDINDLIRLYRNLWSDPPMFNNDLHYWQMEFRKLDLSELLEFDYLACWCKLSEKCHADVLIELCEKMLAERNEMELVKRIKGGL